LSDVAGASVEKSRQRRRRYETSVRRLPAAVHRFLRDVLELPHYIWPVSSDSARGTEFIVGEDGMTNNRASAGFATLAVLLAISGLGYAHFHLESVLWVVRVAVTSIWNLAAGHFAVSLVNAGILLFPVALATLILAKAVGGHPKS
jgi:hypothetical protein